MTISEYIQLELTILVAAVAAFSLVFSTLQLPAAATIREMMIVPLMEKIKNKNWEKNNIVATAICN